MTSANGVPRRPIRHLPSPCRSPGAGARCAWIGTAICAALLLPPLSARAQPQGLVSIDEAVIIVNNKIMTRREFSVARELQLKELQARFKGDEFAQAVKRLDANMIDQMVDNLLIEARADEVGISVSDKEIDQRLDSIVRRDTAVLDNYSEEQLKDYIYKDALRRQVIQREVNSRVRVEDDEVKRACRAEAREDREVDVGHILVRGHDEAALQKIRAIQRLLAEGADFEQTAAAKSEDPSAATNRGRLGFISRGQFVKEFEEKAFSMTPGQVSEPVATQYGYHLIKVFGERAKQGVNCEALDDANRQRIFNRLFTQASEKRMQDFLADLKKRADIVVRIQ
jgi:foldase protein PrsA